MKGIIKNFNRRRGYGWIQPLIGKPDQVEDVWFHASNVRSSRGWVDIVPRGAVCDFICVRAEGEHQLQAADIQLCEVQPRMKSPETSPAETAGLVRTADLLKEKGATACRV